MLGKIERDESDIENVRKGEQTWDRPTLFVTPPPPGLTQKRINVVPDGANLVTAAWESIKSGQVAEVPKDCLWLLILLAARNLLSSEGP